MKCCQTKCVGDSYELSSLQVYNFSMLAFSENHIVVPTHKCYEKVRMVTLLSICSARGFWRV